MPETEPEYLTDTDNLPTVPPAEVAVVNPEGENDTLPPIVQARVLIWAENYGAPSAAKAFQITTARVDKIRHNFIAKPDRHPKLVKAVETIRNMDKERWGDAAHAARAAAINFISRASHEADPRDPDMVNAITNALTVISEIIAVDRYLDAKILALGIGGTGSPEGGPMATIDSQPGRHPRAG